MEVAKVFELELLHVGHAAANGRTVDGPVQETQCGQRREALRLLALAREAVEPLVADAFEIFGEEGRLLRHLAEELERSVEIRAERGQAYSRLVAPGVGVERRAEPLHGLGELEPAVLRGALGQEPRGQRREPALAVGHAARACARDQPQRHDGCGAFDEVEREAVRKACHLRHRKLERAWLAGRRLLLAEGVRIRR